MEHDEWLTTTQARTEYGITTERMMQLLRDGVIPFTPNPNDKRVKLIRRSDMERYQRWAAGFPKPKKPKKEHD